MSSALPYSYYNDNSVTEKCLYRAGVWNNHILQDTFGIKTQPFTLRTFTANATSPVESNSSFLLPYTKHLPRLHSYITCYWKKSMIYSLDKSFKFTPTTTHIKLLLFIWQSFSFVARSPLRRYDQSLKLREIINKIGFLCYFDEAKRKFTENG